MKKNQLFNAPQWCIFFLLLALFIACNKDNNDIKSSNKEIISFILPEQTVPATINSTDHTVLLEVANGTNLAELAPVIELSAGATSDPASAEAVNFSDGPVDYVVTAEDGSTLIWVVNVLEKNSSAADILTFSLNVETSAATIEDSIVTSIVYGEADLKHLAPVITVSPGATIIPASGDTVDFTSNNPSNLTNGTIVYTVTAEDSTKKQWYITVNRPPNTYTNILSFNVPGQIGESVIDANSVNFDLPYGTDLSAITPEIKVSPYATIEPASGETVDFSDGSEIYTVTSETGRTKAYTVYANYEMIPANNENIQYCGRIDYTDITKPKFWAPGVYIKAKYQGSECVVVIKDEVKYGSSHNYLHVIIDDTINYRIKLTGSVNNIKVGEGLPDGAHTIVVSKATESEIGYLQFYGFRCENLLPLTEPTSRKIEFIGNSITCGSGLDVSQVACNAGVWYDQHNAYLSYGALTARTLDAQYHLTSVSGIGLYHSCCNMTYTMPMVFGKINPGSPSGANWDFGQYVPDVVTVCLGQNDGVQDSTTFCNTYVSFIGQIRTAYPLAKIVLLTSPMADATLTNVLKNYLTGVVNYMNTHGDANVSKYFFTTSYNSGCGSHPNQAEHVLIANELTTYLETLMGW